MDRKMDGWMDRWMDTIDRDRGTVQRASRVARDAQPSILRSTHPSIRPRRRTSRRRTARRRAPCCRAARAARSCRVPRSTFMTGAPPARPAPRHRPACPAPHCATPSPTSACKALRAHIRILPAEAAPSTHIACPLSTWAEARLDRTESTLLCPLYLRTNPDLQGGGASRPGLAATQVRAAPQ